MHYFPRNNQMVEYLDILVLDGDDALREAIIGILGQAGYHAVGISHADELEESGQHSAIDVYILGLNPPSEEGLELSRRLRAAEPFVGIIMITGEDTAHERARGYASGADITLSKPVDSLELLTCLGSLGRRLRTVPSTGNDTHLTLCLKTMTLAGPIGSVELSMHEARIIGAFARSRNSQLERWQIAELIGANIENIHRNNLDQRMVRLRRKLLIAGAGAPAIRAMHKTGYFLSTTIRIT